MKRACFCVLLALAAFLSSARGERVVLRGGTRIDAPLIKRDGRMTVVDMGFDVLRIPNEEILQVSEDAVDEAVDAMVEGRIYTEKQMSK